MSSKFEIHCSHVSNTLIYACPYRQSTEIVKIENLCKECFTPRRSEVIDMALGTLDITKLCIDCKSSPARFNRNLMISICDNCRNRGKGECLIRPAELEYPDEILENRIFLGSLLSASRRDVLHALNISVIISCGLDISMPFAHDEDSTIFYYNVPIADNLDQEIVPFLSDVVALVDESLKRGKNVLFHCQLGVSRSAALTIGYVMMTKRMSYYNAYVLVKSRRDCVSPNRRFVNDLERLWQPRCL